MTKVTVLGSGLVGSAIIKDLTKNPELSVSVIEKDKRRVKELVESGIETQNIDVLDASQLKKAVENSDLIVDALPGFLGYRTLKRIIKEGKPIVDISFFAEDPFSLNELAKEKGVGVVIDCGVAPGLSNMLLGYAKTKLDKVESFVCYVGGLPIERELPFQYKAPFSPIDVIEEYIRPARIKENGQIVVKEALSEAELIHFPGIGTLEAFNTDGLRTLLVTMKDIPNMKEKTLRYPGHLEKIKFLKECGFFDLEPININGSAVRPIELTSKILIEHWRLQEGEEDLTVMKIIVKGEKEGEKITLQYTLRDFYDKETNTLSMARTTGYTASIVAQLMVKGKITDIGVIPPELIGSQAGLFAEILAELRKRNVIILEKII